MLRFYNTRFLAIAVLLCSVFTAPQSVHAARFTGEYLLQVCGVDEKGRELVKDGHIACQSYIAGILDYHNLIRSFQAAPGIDFWVPAEASLNVLQEQISQYIFENRGEHEKFIASPGVALALFARYPCEKTDEKAGSEAP